MVQTMSRRVWRNRSGGWVLSWSVALVLIANTATAEDHGPLVAATSAPVGTVIKAKGRYYEAPGISKNRVPLRFFRFNYKNLRHRAPWVVFHVMLDQTVDLDNGELRLIFGQVSEDLKIKVEARDARYSRTYSGSIAYELMGGENQVIRLRGKGALDGFYPFSWQRMVQWPRFDSIQFVGITLEARSLESPDGSLRLDRIVYVPDEGKPVNLWMWSNRIFCYEHTPARGYIERKRKSKEKAAQPDDGVSTKELGETRATGAVGTHAPADPKDSETEDGEKATGGEVQVPESAHLIRSEATLDAKRDDPSTVLFVSGAGHKLGIDPLDALGMNAQINLRTEGHRIDSLLVNHTRKEYAERRFLDLPHSPRQFFDEPVVVWSGLGSLIFDIPESDFPRFRFTYEDVDIDSNSTIELDARQQVYEVAMLWNSQYLGEKRRYRLTLEPAYQYWKVTTTSDDAFIPFERHRGILNAVFHDDWEQREFFALAIFGRSNHKDVDADEAEQEYRFEYRQWHGEEILAYSTIGLTYTQTELDVLQNPFPINDIDQATPLTLNHSRRKDYLREFRLFGNYITELDEQGRWRWFTEVGYRRTDIDALLAFFSNATTNLTIDFVEIDTRIIFEALPDMDVSLGVSHDVVIDVDQTEASDVISASGDQHLFDNISVEGRLSLFNIGNSRFDMRAQQTFYYHLGDQLTTFFLQFNFAR